MEKEKLNYFLNNVILDKFLLNFIPGVILVYKLALFLGFPIREGMLSFLVVTSFSWILGMILELVFFNEKYQMRIKGVSLSLAERLKLLYGKIGISIIIVCVLFMIDLEWILNVFDKRNSQEMIVIYAIIKLVFFFGSGVLLYKYSFKEKVD